VSCLLCQTMSAIGIFIARQRLAHFKINRKHRGKCLALICVDFSLQPTTNPPPSPISSRGRSLSLSLFLSFSIRSGESRKYYPLRLITSHSETAIISQGRQLEPRCLRIRRTFKEARERFVPFLFRLMGTQPLGVSLSSMYRDRRYSFVRLRNGSRNKIESRTNELFTRRYKRREKRRYLLSLMRGFRAVSETFPKRVPSGDDTFIEVEAFINR